MYLLQLGSQVLVQYVDISGSEHILVSQAIRSLQFVPIVVVVTAEKVRRMRTKF